MYQMNELSVTLQHLILLLRFLRYKKVKEIAERNGKFGDLPTKPLSGGVTSIAPHCRYEPGVVNTVGTAEVIYSSSLLSSRNSNKRS